MDFPGILAASQIRASTPQGKQISFAVDLGWEVGQGS